MTPPNKTGAEPGSSRAEKTVATTVLPEQSLVNQSNPEGSPVTDTSSILAVKAREKALNWLARLSDTEYEAYRNAVARQLKVPPSILDKERAARKKQSERIHGAAPQPARRPLKANAPEKTDGVTVSPQPDSSKLLPAPKPSADAQRPLRVSPPAKQVSFDEWHALIAANFPALFRPAEICASVVAQLLINDVTNPFALALVDVPSSGKTITLNFFDVSDLAYTTDSFTPASFVSHASNVGRDDLSKVDLLPRIRFRTLIVRDLAPIFGAKEDDVLKTMGILTRVLDGEGLRIDSGVHGGRGYSGDYTFMLLAGTTPIPPRVFKIMGTLGSRLFFLALHSPAKGQDELIAQNRVGTRSEKERVCRKATENFLRTLWSRFPDGVNWNRERDLEDCLRVIAQCAQLLAVLRGTIQVWPSGFGETLDHSVPIIEQPDRINCLLYNLARGHALLAGRTQISQADLAPVLEVAFDSAPTIRSKVFRGLLEHNGTLKTSQVERILRCSKPTALKEMEALAVLGIVEKIEVEFEQPIPPQLQTQVEALAVKEGRCEHAIRLVERFAWFGCDECKSLRWAMPKC